MAKIKINGIYLNTDIKGEGESIILIHGSGEDHTHLNNIVDQLSRIFKTITYDCRGHGESDKPSKYTMKDHVDDVLGIMDFYEIPTTHLLGVSMGSYIAQGVAIAVPKRIKKLILTVTRSNGLTSSVQRLFSEHSNEIEGLDMHGIILALLKYMVYNTEVMKNHIEVFDTKLTPEQFALSNKAIAGFDFRNGLTDIEAETLVISGKYDGLNPPVEGRNVASLIPNSTFVEMQYSGHAPSYEEPETYIKIVTDFLTK